MVMKGKTPLQKKHPRSTHSTRSSVDLHAHTLLFQQNLLERRQNSRSREQNIVGCRARFISGRTNFVSCPETSLNGRADSRNSSSCVSFLRFGGTHLTWQERRKHCA